MTHDPNQKDIKTPLPIEDREFDLLVDGELDESRRRELLSGLDGKPGGWRRCALAFLEAQSWRKELRTPSRSDHHPSSEAASVEVALAKPRSSRRARRRSPGWVGAVLGAAASFLLAVGLTSLMRDLQRPGVPGAMPSGQLATMANPGGESAGASFGSSSRASDGRGNVQLVSLAAADPSGVRNKAGLPAVSRERLDEEWLQNTPSAIPDGIAQAFHHAGHEVRTSRQVLPLQMRDGRRLMVPVDQLDVHYVNNPTYQ